MDFNAGERDGKLELPEKTLHAQAQGPAAAYQLSNKEHSMISGWLSILTAWLEFERIGYGCGKGR